MFRGITLERSRFRQIPTNFLTFVARWVRDSVFRTNRRSVGEMWLNRQTDTHTDPPKYCNPRCACAPRVNYVNLLKDTKFYDMWLPPICDGFIHYPWRWRQSLVHEWKIIRLCMLRWVWAYTYFITFCFSTSPDMVIISMLALWECVGAMQYGLAISRSFPPQVLMTSPFQTWILCRLVRPQFIMPPGKAMHLWLHFW